ncbi:Hypothetical protein Cp226_0614 [Corynebacterium pseudotuberculosis]|nr:Hypothetical protein Cp226_0614 [Corynebacterium pseudotuberculosis]
MHINRACGSFRQTWLSKNGLRHTFCAYHDYSAAQREETFFNGTSRS